MPEVKRNFIIGQHNVEPVICDPGSSSSNVPRCSCGKCIVFTDPRMNRTSAMDNVHALPQKQF